MSVIYFSIGPSLSGGGPSVFVHKAATEFAKRKHKIIYKRPQNADVALCIINTGNILSVVGDKTKVMLRIDGIYNKIYNEKFNRSIRPDMIALHNELARDIPKVNHVCYQSRWSRDRIWDEIVKADNPKKYSIIHNGVDIGLFKPSKDKKKNDFINLIHVGKMRDAYLMEMLVGTYKEVQRRGHKVKLILVGTMDAGCQKVLSKHTSDPNIKHVGNFTNDKLTSVYNMGDIFIDARQGASCNNVVAEAQACGIPVITPSWGGSCEMVSDGQTGIIVDGGKWDYDKKYIQGLSDAVEKIIPDLSGFSVRSRAHAIKNLSVQVMINKYIKAMGI